MIDLYYWTTPNGHKITMFLEETGLKYKIFPVNIGKGEQFKPEFLAVAPNNRIPATGRSRAQGRDQADLDLRIRRDAALSRREDRQIPARRHLRPLRRHSMDVLADGRSRADGGAEPSFPQLRGQEKLPYAIDRYVNETNRLYGVLNKRLADREFIGGDYSIADMACYPWVVPYKNQGQDIDQFPHLKRWLETIRVRPATVRAYAKAKEVNPNFGQPAIRTEEERKILFGQTAAVVK